MDKTLPSRSLLLYFGLVLLLSGTVAARGGDMVIVLLGGIALLVLEVAELRSLSPERAVAAQLILSGTLLLLGIIKAVESIGKQFTTHHFYLMMMLIGLVLILIESAKRYASSEMGRLYAAPLKPTKMGS